MKLCEVNSLITLNSRSVEGKEFSKTQGYITVIACAICVSQCILGSAVHVALGGSSSIYVSVDTIISVVGANSGVCVLCVATTNKTVKVHKPE